MHVFTEEAEAKRKASAAAKNRQLSLTDAADFLIAKEAALMVLNDGATIDRVVAAMARKLDESALRSHLTSLADQQPAYFLRLVANLKKEIG